MESLYSLQGKYLDLQNLLLNVPEGEGAEEYFLAVEAAMNEIGGNIEEKAENYAKVKQNLEGLAAAARAEADRLNKRAKSFEVQGKRLVENLYFALKVCGKDKIQTPLFTFTISKNPASVQTDDQFGAWALKENRFLRINPPEIAKDELKKALQAGEKIPGAWLEQGESLRIR